jgi:amino acid transporter/nucleotide-binding universal stress UspA family protein
MHDTQKALPPALAMLASERPRNVGWFSAAGMLFGDWGTSRLYVLGLAFLVAGRTSFWLISMMSLLILAVGWAYTQICRIYPDGGGVYTAARQRSALLGVIGALLLFADYTITASLSAVDAFHYFGLPLHHEQQVAADHEVPTGMKAAPAEEADAGDTLIISHEKTESKTEPLWTWDSPGFWAIVSILVIGAFNLMGPKHTAGFAVFAAAGMVAITVLIVICAIPQLGHSQIHLGDLHQDPLNMWQGFVAIVLALSGCEAIANLTGVMHKPVYRTASKSIWTVALEVAVFNLILAVAMIAINPLSRSGHTEDMLAFMARHYVGVWGEWPVRIIGGLLLLSATNTAVNGLMSITYVMSRDNELPRIFQKLNSFGAPWIGAIVAAGVPVLVLLFYHDVETLAHLYAIGIVGAVAINCTLCSTHPRLRKARRKIGMLLLGIFLVAIWITLAITKIHALIFVTIVLAVGLILRQVTRAHGKRRPKPSLLRQAIVEQLPEDALSRPKVLLATAGSDTLADQALEVAKESNAALVVCFIRGVALSYKVEAETRLTLDTDPAAQALFADFLAHGHRAGVPIIPMYDTGTNSAELIAEHAALNGVEKVLIGSSRRGTLHRIIKGSFQQQLESLLPPEIPVQVISATEQAAAAT